MRSAPALFAKWRLAPFFLRTPAHCLTSLACSARVALADPSQRLPEARLHEYGGSPPGSIPKHPVNGLLQVVGQEQAAQLFTSFGGSTPGKLQLAVVDKGVVHQIFHWFNWWHLVDGALGLSKAV